MMRELAGAPRYTLPIFLILAYGLSWWSAPLANGQILPYGPTVAAVTALALTGGATELTQLWRRVTLWRVRITWYVAGPALIAACHAAALGGLLLLGAQPISAPHLTSGTTLELLLIGGYWEEPGWSGYLLPAMLHRFEQHPRKHLMAALVTGAFRCLWHLPLVIYGHILWFDAFVFVLAFQVLVAWVFYQSGGSVPAVMALHLATNLLGAFTYPLFSGAERATYLALFTAAAALCAVALIARGRLVAPKDAQEVTVVDGPRYRRTRA